MTAQRPAAPPPGPPRPNSDQSDPAVPIRADLLARAEPLVLVHRGALGDFLLSWPAIRALALGRERPGGLEMPAACGPAAARAASPPLWAGREEYLFFLRPLGVLPAPPGIRRAVDRLYAGDPSALPEGAAVVRFVLRPPADTPNDPRVLTLPSVAAEGFDPPGLLHARALAALGLDLPGDGPRAFRRLFARPDRAGGQTPALPAPHPRPLALLFPGAGHRAKAWPLVQFLELARWLDQEGLAPGFVLGPAEQERGMQPAGFPVLRPGTLPDLAQALNQAELAVGNDCGPMHLAGMLGLPGVALFGPTSRRQWGPAGLTLLARDLACRPCTRTTAGLDCPDPACLADLSVQEVARAIRDTRPSLFRS